MSSIHHNESPSTVTELRRQLYNLIAVRDQQGSATDRNSEAYWTILRKKVAVTMEKRGVAPELNLADNLADVLKQYRKK